MSWLGWLAVIPWMLVPVVLACGLPFWWAKNHIGGRVDRFLERIFL
jgi:hypothetical protein